MCDKWRYDSKLFIQWSIENNYKVGLYIDRTDNDGNYEPSNCKYVTAKENARNRRNTIFLNIDNSMQKFAVLREQGRCVVSDVAIMWRIKKGWSDQDAISTPRLRNPKKNK